MYNKTHVNNIETTFFILILKDKWCKFECKFLGFVIEFEFFYENVV